MNILFLDDSHSRHDFVCKKEHLHKKASICDHGKYKIFHAYTISEIIELFEQYYQGTYFDFVYLDHDLSITDPRRVGTIVAKYMADNYDKLSIRIGKIIIHSWNSAGAKNMEAILRGAGYKDILVSPFSVA